MRSIAAETPRILPEMSPNPPSPSKKLELIGLAFLCLVPKTRLDMATTMWYSFGITSGARPDENKRELPRSQIFLAVEPAISPSRKGE